MKGRPHIHRGAPRPEPKTRDERIQRAAEFLRKIDGKEEIAAGIEFLKLEKGLTDLEVMEALHLATSEWEPKP